MFLQNFYTNRNNQVHVTPNQASQFAKQIATVTIEGIAQGKMSTLPSVVLVVLMIVAYIAARDYRRAAELQAEQQSSRAAIPPVRPTEPSAGSSSSANQPSPVVIEVQDVEVADLEPPPAYPRETSADSGAQQATVGAEPPQGPPDRVKRAVTEEGQALYDRGYTLFHRGQYLDAETVFQQFLADFGATDLGDNAQFWIGEARFAREDLSGAMAAFRQVVSQYPDGNKVPDALLKIADCQRGLGDIEGARRSYQEVSERFPFAAAAAVAEDRLRDLP